MIKSLGVESMSIKPFPPKYCVLQSTQNIFSLLLLSINDKILFLVNIQVTVSIFFYHTLSNTNSQQ